ncbi:MAG: GEVED domain-containing protein [Saprospiraceae bacterium]
MKQTHTFQTLQKWGIWVVFLLSSFGLTAMTSTTNFFQQSWDNYSTQLDAAFENTTTSITISSPQTCTGRTRDLWLVKSGSNTEIKISNGETICRSDINFSHAFFRIRTDGDLQSMTYHISGAIQSSNTENHAPYDSRSFDIRNGTYSVRVRLYSHDNAQGDRCDDDTFTFTIADCSSCDGAVTGLKLINSNGNGSLNISNGQTVCKQDFNFNHGQWEVLTSGHLESVRISTSGAVHDDKLENIEPYNSNAFTINEGDYSVNAKVYSLDGAGGVECDDRTFSFRIETCNLDPCADAGGDSDGDGVCNDDDCRPNNPNISNPGDACNDGNASTSNDRIRSDCSCRGDVVDPCDSAGGDSDNDGVCNDDDCRPNDSNFPATPGSACNDGNPNTINDQVGNDGCSCAGTPSGGGGNIDCDAVTLSGDGGKITLTGLGAPNVLVTIFSLPSYQIVYSCGGHEEPACGSTQMTGALSTGQYRVTYKFFTASWTPICERSKNVTVNGGGGGGDPCDSAGGDSDNDGVCNDDDCRPNNPNISSPGDACNDGNPNTTNDRIQADCGCRGTTTDLCANAGGDSDGDGVCNNDDCEPNNPNISSEGDACNDGNPNTTNDVIKANCVCAGTPSGGGGNSDCDNVSFSGANGELTIGNLGAPIVIVKVFNSSWQEQSGAGCSGASCSTSETYDVPNGLYHVSVKFFNASWQPICEKSQDVTVSGDGGSGGGGNGGGGGTSNITITCPNDINVTQNQSGGRIVSWTPPTASTTCSGNVTITQTTGPTKGNLFPVGVTNVSYSFTDNCGSSRTCSFTVTVNPDNTGGGGGGSAPTGYCSARGTSPWTQWIKNVRVGSINNSSGKDGYSNFTSSSTDASRGSSLSVSLTPGFSYTHFNMSWRVWIDWNRDGDFSDAGELAFSKSGTGAMSGSIHVPSDAQSGLTRMRVAAKKDSAPSACSDFGPGEVEDYTVNIKGGSIAPLVGDRNTATLLYPNPAQRIVQLDLTTMADTNVTINIIDQTGKTIYHRQFVNAPAGAFEIDLAQFAAGIYFVKIQNQQTQLVERLLITKR